MAENPSPRRWLMISFAFWATLINYLDRQTLSVAAPVLREQFHMSNVMYSHVLFAFLLAYTIMNGVSGPLIDRLGTRLGYALCVGWWSLSALLHAFARGPISLGVFRFLLGTGEAGNWSAGVKVVSEWFPERERALASGIFNSGAAAGAILAPPVVALIILKLGWPAAFAFTGVAGFVWLAFWLPKYRSPEAIVTAGSMDVPGLSRQSEATTDGPSGPALPSKPRPVPVGQLIRTRFVIWFTLSKIFMDPAWYFYIFWFPEYLKRARHFDLAAIGKYAWIPFAVAGLGNFLGGMLSSLLFRRGLSSTHARKGAASFFAFLMTATVPAVLVNNAAVSIALVSIAMLGYTGCLANMMAMPADVFPQHAVASVWGLAGLGSGSGGMIFALMTGWVVDHFSYTPVFFGFGLMPLIFVLMLWTLVGPLRPARLGPPPHPL